MTLVISVLLRLLALTRCLRSLHLGNVTTVDLAITVQLERPFETAAPSVSQRDWSRCSRELNYLWEVFHVGPRSSSEDPWLFSHLSHSILDCEWTMSLSKCSEPLRWVTMRTIVGDDHFWNFMQCKYGFQIVHDRGWRSVVKFCDLGKCWQVDSLKGSAQKIYEPTVCHGNSGTSDGIIGSNRFWLSLENFSHFLTKYLICLLRPGHQSDCFARSLNFVIPSWVFPSIVCMAAGIRRRLPLSNNPFWIVRSAATCR